MALVVFLRGVNVGGYRRFRPSILAKQLKRFDVVNIGATGTFVVRGPVNRVQLRAEIARRLPFKTELMICDGRDILALESAAPFADLLPEKDVIRFVSILARQQPPPATPISLPPNGDWSLKVLAHRGRFVLGLHRREMKAIGYLGQLERILGVPVTTRNWTTMLRVAQILRGTSRPRARPQRNARGVRRRP